jgi:hypothetical protein
MRQLVVQFRNAATQLSAKSWPAFVATLFASSDRRAPRGDDEHTVFSLAVLSVMVGIAMKMMQAITAAFAVKYLAAMGGMGDTNGINSMALQRGGVGLLLSTLIVMAPPKAAAFFQGTLGQFASYSSFGNVGPQLGGQDQQAIAQGRQAAMSGGGSSPKPMSQQDRGNARFAEQGQQVQARGLHLPNDSVVAADSTKFRTTDRDQT